MNRAGPSLGVGLTHLMESLDSLTPIRKPSAPDADTASGLGEGLLALLGLAAGGALAASWQQWQVAAGPDLLTWLACISAFLGALALIGLADIRLPSRWAPEHFFIALALAWALVLVPGRHSPTRLG